MVTNDQTLIKIIIYGILKHSPEEIAELLKLTKNQKIEFLAELNDPKSQIATYYNQALEMGEHNIKAQLLKNIQKGDVFSIIQLTEIEKNKKIDDLKKKLFGI